MGRSVPFDEAAVCDACGKTGAYDFMGDLLCPACAGAAMAEQSECERSRAEFDEKYAGDPAFNSEGTEGAEGQMETFPPHLTRVIGCAITRPRTVWSIVDSAHGLRITAGLHPVNCVLYFVSREPWESEHEEYAW